MAKGTETNNPYKIRGLSTSQPKEIIKYKPLASNMLAYELVKVEGHLTDKDRPRDKAPRENKVYTAFLRKESLNHQYLRGRPLERANQQSFKR